MTSHRPNQHTIDCPNQMTTIWAFGRGAAQRPKQKLIHRTGQLVDLLKCAPPRCEITSYGFSALFGGGPNKLNANASRFVAINDSNLHIAPFDVTFGIKVKESVDLAIHEIRISFGQHCCLYRTHFGAELFITIAILNLPRDD